MLFLSYILAGISVIYFFGKVPHIVPERLLIGNEIPLIKKVLITGGIIAGLYIISWIFSPEEGYTTSNMKFPFILLFMSASLLLWGLMQIDGKVKDYYTRTYANVMNETSGARETLIEANRQIELIEQQKDELEILQLEFSEKQETLLNQQNSIENLQLELNEKEDQLNKQKHQIETIISETVSQKEEALVSHYELKLSQLKEEMVEYYNSKMVAYTDNLTRKMEQRILNEKQAVIDDVFSFEDAGKDDFFEIKKMKESLDKEKEEIEKNRFLMDMDQKISQANEHVLNAKSSALEIKSENVDLRTELKLMGSEFKMNLTQEKMNREKSVDDILHRLELEQERRKSDFLTISNQLAMMDVKHKAQLIELSSTFNSALKDLEVKTSNGFISIKENISDMKLSFGNEILRLDGKQGQILTELEKYYAKNQQFVNQCHSIALEARSQNLQGQQLLSKVNHLHGQFQLETKEAENRLRTGMENISLQEAKLANSIGESMLKLKSLSDEQYIAMKDMALEKKGVDLLWKEKNMEHELNLQEVRHQKQNLEHTRQLLNQEQSSFNQHKSNALENARLTHKIYMDDQEHRLALEKAQNSGGFLTRWARNIEKLREKK